jgi:protein disulfide-isomerase
MCPFCYIGKRNFEKALERFPGRDSVEVEWKSFQLDPSIPDPPGFKGNIYQYLAGRKGISYEESVKMHERVVKMAAEAGLQYRFDLAKVANSFKAHRLIQMAKAKHLGDQAEERLFLAYFTQGMDMSDAAVLAELGKEIGLSGSDVNEALSNDEYAYKVRQDIAEAEQLGLRGVPFFVFNRKYGISGAQPPEAFVQVLEKAQKD